MVAALPRAPKIISSLLGQLLLLQGSARASLQQPSDLRAELQSNVVATEGGAEDSTDSFQADLPSVGDYPVVATQSQPVVDSNSAVPAVQDLSRLEDAYDEHVFGQHESRQHAKLRLSKISSVAAQVERQKYQQQLRSVIGQAQVSKRQTRELSTELQEEHEQLTAAKTQLQELGSSLEKAKANSSNLAGALEAAGKQVRTLRLGINSKDKLLHASALNAQEVTALREEEQAMKKKVQKLEEDAREAVRSREIAEVNSTHLASALSEAAREVSDLRATLEKSSAERKASRNQDSMARQVSQAVESQKELMEKLSIEEKARAAAVANSTALAKSKHGLAAKLNRLTASLHAKDEELSKVFQELKSQRKQVGALRSEETAERQKEQDLEKEEGKRRGSQSTNSRLSASMSALSNELKKMQDTLRSKDAELKEERRRNKELAGQLQAATATKTVAAKEGEQDFHEAMQTLDDKATMLSSALARTKRELEAARQKELTLEAERPGQAEFQKAIEQQEKVQTGNELKVVSQMSEEINALKYKAKHLVDTLRTRTRQLHEAEAQLRQSGLKSHEEDGQDEEVAKAKTVQQSRTEEIRSARKAVAAVKDEVAKLQESILESRQRAQQKIKDKGEMHVVSSVLGDTAKLLEATSEEAMELLGEKDASRETASASQAELQATKQDLARSQQMVQARNSAIMRLETALDRSIQVEANSEKESKAGIAQDASRVEAPADGKQTKSMTHRSVLAVEQAATKDLEGPVSKAKMLESLREDLQKLKRVSPAHYEELTKLFAAQRAHRQILKQLAACGKSSKLGSTSGSFSEEKFHRGHAHSPALHREVQRVVSELRTLQSEVGRVSQQIRIGNSRLMRLISEAPRAQPRLAMLQKSGASFESTYELLSSRSAALGEAVAAYTKLEDELSADQQLEAGADASDAALRAQYSKVLLEKAALAKVLEEAKAGARLLREMRSVVDA